LILTHRDTLSLLDSSSSDPLKPYKDLLLDLTINDPTAKEKVVELLKYQHHLNEAQQLFEWTLPRFPVSGGTLAANGIKQGPTYKVILNELREAWKKSHYQATENQLIDEVLPSVLERLANTNTDSSGSQSKKRKEKD
jgi:hypothetical protein